MNHADSALSDAAHSFAAKLAREKDAPKRESWLLTKIKLGRWGAPPGFTSGPFGALSPRSCRAMLGSCTRPGGPIAVLCIAVLLPCPPRIQGVGVSALRSPSAASVPASAAVCCSRSCLFLSRFTSPQQKLLPRKSCKEQREGKSIAERIDLCFFFFFLS